MTASTAPTTPAKASEKSEEIVGTAYEIFYRNGFHATGVDALLADSGISKRTLYKYFRSKEALIAATVAHYQRETFRQVLARTAALGGDPRAQVLAIFDLKAEAVAAGNFCGCFAINAKLEYEGKDAGVEAACEEFRRALQAFMLARCEEAGIAEPHAAAQKLLILLDGAIVYGLKTQDPEAVKLAKEMAAAVLGVVPGPIT